MPFSPKQSPQLKIVLILYSPSDLDRTQRVLNSRGNLQTPPRYLQDFLLSSLHQGIPDTFRRLRQEISTLKTTRSQQLCPFSLSYLGGFTAFFSRSIPPKGFTAAVAATVEGAAAWVWAFGCPFATVVSRSACLIREMPVQSCLLVGRMPAAAGELWGSVAKKIWNLT